MEINLKDKCGKQTITRKDGKVINQIIIESWGKENKIIIDFNNILIASVSFLDEAIGKLAFEYPKKELTEKLSLKDIVDYDKSLLNDILISRYHQKELEKKPKPRAKKLKN